MAGWKAPTLYLDGTELRLTAIIFYWGVRRTVINVVAARSSAKITAPSTSSVIIPPAVASGADGTDEGRFRLDRLTKQNPANRRR